MLLKGINKRVIVIKNPESEIFEEAYFIVKSSDIKGVFKQSKENEMVIEANRIITDYHNQQRSIIEKNGIASGVGDDMAELDNFLNGKNNKITGFGNTGKSNEKFGNTEKTDKNKKENKLNETQKLARVSDDEIFEDEKFFENIQNNADKFEDLYHNPELAAYGREKPHKPAFRFISSKKIRFRNLRIPMPPKSFFIGVGFMSAIIILIRLLEVILLR